MVSIKSFPHAVINLQDQPVQQLADPTVLPLHLPIFCTFAEKGPIGIPVRGGTNALTALFGSGFLNERSAYFKHPNVFIQKALDYQQIYLVRVADPSATKASLVLLCTVTPADIPQYQRTESGSLILTNGEPTPLLQSDNVTPVTEPGVTLHFTVRQLANNETITTVATTTTSNGGVTSHTYPIIALDTTVGGGGNMAGFRMFSDPNRDTTIDTNIGALTFSFQPVTLDSLTNIEAPIYDIYNSQTQTFSFKPGAYDASTASYYELQEVIDANFSGLSGLPYNFYVYNTNVGTIGTTILGVSPELTSVGAYEIDFLSGLDTNGNTYDHFTVDGTAASVFNANVVQYLAGGTDGALTKTMLEAQSVAFYTGETYPAIGDAFRYPFTHIYDSGFTLQNKQALMGVYALRDDVKIEFSTQDLANPPNTAAQDQSTGSAIRTSALLNPESVDMGTQACRAAIYQQCAKLIGSIYKDYVPASLDRMVKRCIYNGTDHVTGEPKGRPNSEVTLFDLTTLNWTPTTDLQKQQSWNTGLNYIQYADVNTLFYPDLLSVYPLDTSLLSSDVFVDYTAVYLKKIIRQQWTIFAGRSDPPARLFKAIANAIDNAASYAFNGAISTSTVVSQTAVDTALGYQLTVTTTVTGSMPNRVWKVIVPIKRS